MFLPKGDVAPTMRPGRFFHFLTVIALFVPAMAHGATSLLPGVTYYEKHEKLTGRLVFLLSRDAGLETNETTSATIYEFDLSENKLKKVTDAPRGMPHVSESGDVFWVDKTSTFC